ncbi:MAG: phage portal protein [Clostridiales bacterium]|nr:phage portal protein [Clostridiales bacterium]
MRENPQRALIDFAPCASRVDSKLYYALRQNVPVIDAAVTKLVRLLGGFKVECSAYQKQCDEILSEIPVGGVSAGLHSFVSQYFEQLLTAGTAVGEIVTDTAGTPRALFNCPTDPLEFRRNKNGFDVDIFVCRDGLSKPVPHPERFVMSALNPLPGAVTGTSLLRTLPFVSGILMKIFETVGENWERAGALRYAVTYRPGNDPDDRAFALERAQQISSAWQSAMKSGSVRDFVAVGDVEIKVIGADGAILDPQVPVSLILEQIVAKTGLPPFMLGLNRTSTERMSSQQADLLTSEIEHYRRILTPVIEKIARVFLLSSGISAKPRAVWEDITLQDEVELAKARLYNAQAEKTEKEINLIERNNG